MPLTDDERRQRNRDRMRASRAANPERERERYRRLREGRIENSRRWRASNPEKVRAYNHRPGGSEQRRIATATWRRQDPEHARALGAEQEARRRALIRGASEVEHIDRAAIIARDKRRCHLCSKRVAKRDLVLDHLVPLARGGSHTAANLAVAHRSCNAKKWVNPANEQLRMVG